MSAPRRGFTLIEVMVAVTILGLGLTMILSSQVGLFASIQRVQNETVATTLMRCKMSEIEAQLLTMGFSLTDQNDSGECCLDEDTPNFDCTWKIETIELPQPATMSGNKTDAMKDVTKGMSSAAASATSSLSSSAAPLSTDGLANMGALGAMSTLEDTKGQSLGANAKPEDLASSFGAAQPAGPAGMATLAMTLVYPTLKPMLEASIRKVSVTVNWKEGTREQKFTVVQYITDPRKGSLNPNAAANLDAAAQASGLLGSGSANSNGSGNTNSGNSK